MAADPSDMNEPGSPLSRRQASASTQKGTMMTDYAAITPSTFDLPPRPLLRDIMGSVLRRTRLEQGRTLADVARAARVSMPYLSELERGRKEASSEVIAAICDALGIELSDVMIEISQALTAHRMHRAKLMRMEAVRSRQFAAPRAKGSGDVFCLAA